ncbi:MAG: class I SAM-dependent methyltransferase [Firmicutes bacterium]|nr:class I SAM-dependent methyltransferase [Bacillota bacterium]
MPDINYPWAGHKYFAYDLVRNLKPERVVELGTYKGTSFFSFCQAVKDGDIKTELVAVDTWRGDKHSGYYDNSVYNHVIKVKNTYYSELKIHFLRKTFDKAAREFDNNSIDILHIDGLHTYQAIKHDFDNWHQKTRRNGVILLHDTAERMKDFGVYKLWNELENKFNTISFTHSHGLGVLVLDNLLFNEISKSADSWKKHYESIYKKKGLADADQC